MFRQLSGEYTPEIVNQCVQNGAKWLDKYCPDWFKELDLELLDLTRGDYCVIGQTAACLTNGVVPSHTLGAYGEVVALLEKTHLWALQHGFQARYQTDFIPPYNPNRHAREAAARWEMLTIAWKEHVRERLAEAV